MTCKFPGIPAGQSASVAIVVAPNAASTYADIASVSTDGGATDPSAVNNQAATTLTVAASTNPGPSKCVVPKLAHSSVGLARNVLPLLGCKVGKATKLDSKSVPKGQLIGTSPGPGSYALNKVIALKVSSGPTPKKHKQK